jgi:hypothetical protein
MMKKNYWRGFSWTTKGPKLAELKEIFDEMWLYYDRYLKQAEDLPYWSTEMALVANLAIAAAKRGYPAALEFFNEKSKGRKRYRADLWLGLDGKNNGIVFEAKCSWVSATIDIEIPRINKYLKEADHYLKRMAKNLKNPQETASWACSLLFSQIYFHAGEIKRYEELINNVEKNILEFKTEKNLSFFAYYFLEKRKIPKRLLLLEDYCYPGIGIFGKIRKFS